MHHKGRKYIGESTLFWGGDGIFLEPFNLGGGCVNRRSQGL